MKKPVVTAFRRALIKSEITFGREDRKTSRVEVETVVEERFAYHATFREIEGNDYNLNILR